MPCRVPEECPADVEAIITRCLDSVPEKRPSARELVEFMVQLPQQFSREGTGVDGSTELSSSEAPASPDASQVMACITLTTQLMQLLQPRQTGSTCLTKQGLCSLITLL